MKSVSILFLYLVLFSEMQAQQLSASIRSGISKGFVVGKTTPGGECGVTSYIFDDEGSYTYPQAKYTLDKSLFVRYQTHGRYAMELNVNHNRFKEQRHGITLPVGNEPIQDYYSSSVEDFYSFSLFFQYDITPKSFKKNKILGRFTPYLGIGVTQDFRNSVFRSEYSQNSTPTYISKTSVRFQMADGSMNMNYVLNYRVTKHLTITALVLCGFQTININWRGSDTYFMPMPNARVGTNIGVSYGIY